MDPLEPIAIAGIGCRFPGGANDAESFWRLMMDGIDAVTEVPADRWSIAKFYDENPDTPGRSISKWGGFVEDPAAFDHEFFGISPREAASLDPQHRMLLLTAAEALTDASQLAAPAGETRDIGVFVGISTHEFSQLQSAPQELTHLDAWSLNSIAATLASNRVSFAFNLGGPSVAVDTACSSSLVAVHMACEAIRRGECSAALAGGANAIYNAAAYVSFSRAGMLSPTGRCKAFDKSADGFVRAEGAGLIFLLPSSVARKQGLRIYAEILGTAVNQDGRKPSMTAPATSAQAELIRSACQRARIEPSRIRYVEAHGTGTPVGDPSEVAAIAESIGAARKEPCLLGSVKTNIGHLEAAAGIAGTIKAALCLHHGAVPPNLHFKEINPAIDLAAGNLRVVTEATKLANDGDRVLAGVNSFGFGGANAHAILAQAREEAPRARKVKPTDDAARLLVISARNPDSLSLLAGRYADLLRKSDGDATSSDVCFSAGLHQSSLPHRLSVVASARDLPEKLEVAAAGGCPPGASRGRAVENPEAPVFVFCGQGSQWTRMGCDLLREEPVFRRKLEEVDRLIRANVGWSLLAELAKDEANTRLNDTEIAQPSIFAIQIALTALWDSWGIKPAAVVGHSVGEAAAACVSGALTLEEATRVICHRAKSMAVCRGQGTMLSVALPVVELQSLVSSRPGRVAIGAVNSPRSAVLSGRVEDIALLGEELTARGVPLRKVRVEYAFHSALMDPARAPLERSLAGIRTHKPSLPLFSTVTGRECSEGNWDAAYWWRNIRQPVLFSDTIARMLELGHKTFLEVGPHPVLGGSLLECLNNAGADARVFSSLRRAQPGREAMLSSLGALCVAGYRANWEHIYPHARRARLPFYPWKLESSWTELPTCRAGRFGEREHPLLGHASINAPGTWNSRVSLDTHSWLADHCVNGQPVFPGAAYVELAFAAALARGMEFPFCIENLDFVKALSLDRGGHTTALRFVLGLDNASFEISAAGDEKSPFVLQARGRLAPALHSSALAAEPATLVDSFESRCTGAELRENLHRRGLELGPAFAGLSEVQWREGEALGCIEMTGQVAPEADDHVFHPAFLDACFGTLACTIPGWRDKLARKLFLPVTFDRVRLHRRPEGKLWAHARLTHAESHLVAGNLTVTDEKGLTVRARAIATTDSADLLSSALYRERWDESAPPSFEADSLREKNILLLTGSSDDSAMLRAQLQKAGANVAQHTSLPPDTRTWDIIVDTRPLAVPSRHNQDALWHAAGDVMGLLREIARQAAAKKPLPRVVLVTSLARQVLPQDTIDPSQTAVSGLIRTSRIEIPGLEVKLIDFDSANPPPETLLAEIAGEDAETEVAWRDGMRVIPRLCRASVADLPGARPRQSASSVVRLREPGPGVELRDAPPRAPLAPDEIRIRVEAAGVNFRDTMKALGIYPVTNDLDLILGDECAGEVVETGSGVADFAAGDKVIAVTPGCFAGEVVAKASRAVLRPSGLSAAEAATVPVVYLTALYALRDIGRMRCGDTVLIHSAAGGVGLAAVQLAQRTGAEIFATAGSETKREALRRMGVKHVMDSRTLGFRDEVMRATGGRGVDTILNSLAGEFLVQSLACLAPGGRFLEIGKRDLYENSKLGLAAFRANQSFTAIDMAQVLLHDPEKTRSLLRDIAEMLAKKEIKPLPHRTLPLEEAPAALREMAQGTHLGKLVLEVPPSPDAPEALAPPFRNDAAYLVTGGVRGFGLATADWMVSHGARHLALVGRSNQKSAVLSSALERWKKSGIEVRVFAADLAERGAVEKIFAGIRESMPPLRGIIHAATRYESATLANADEETLRASFGAKACGAQHLDACSEGLELDFFVLYSSVAGVLGNAGQAGYAAANAFLQGLAAKRRAEGRPALVVHWGALSDAGHVADHAEIASLLESRGLGGMTAAESTVALGQIMRSSAGEAVIARIRWEDAAGLGIGADAPRLRELVAISASGSSGGGKSAREAILSLPAEERLPAMTADLAAQLSEILRLPEASIEPGASLKDLGLDSLISIETVIRIERRFAVSLPQGWITADTTLEDLAGKLLHLIGTTSATPSSVADTPVASIDRPTPPAIKNAGHSTGTELPADNMSDGVSAGFYVEWLALRAMEKLLLGRDIGSARRRLSRLLPVFRTALRHDWKWSLKNLELVFGPNLDEAQREKLALLAMENHLASYLESGFSHGMEFEFDDYAELLELAGDRGVILCGAHLGSWEPFLRWAPDIGLRLAAVYRKARNPLAERTFQQRRSLYGIEWIPSGDVRAIAQAIDDRKIVAFMTDLNSYESAIFPDFLGVPASFAPGPCALSVLKGAPLIAGVGIRQSVSKVAATFAPALWPDLDRPMAAETSCLAAKLNEFFGSWILEYAEQYNWLHPRWRCRPDGSVWTLKTPAKEMAMARTAPYTVPSERLLRVITGGGDA